MAKLSFFNKVTVKGYVFSFNIKEGAKFKLANIGIEDTVTKNRTYVTLFDNKNGIKYNGSETTLEGLKKIFMNADDTPRHVFVEANGRISETKGTNRNGEETVFVNTTIFSIEPCYDESEQYATVILNGIVDGVKVGEDSNGETKGKLKIGVLKYNKNGDIIGCDSVGLTAYGEVAEELENQGVERGCFVRVYADMLNTQPQRNKYGDIISNGKKEIQLTKIKGVTDAYEIEDFVNSTYKQAKKLKRGETITVKKSKTDDLEDIAKPSKKVDEFSDDDLDF